jgi:hypothetical protein
MCGVVVLLSEALGVLVSEALGVLLSGVEVEFGLVVLLGLVLFGEVEFTSELLELDVDGEVEFMSEVLEGDVEVVEEGELDVEAPVWLLWLEGVLCALLAPLPAPLPSLPPAAVPVLLWATAMPVEKITAVASVRNLLRIFVFLPGRCLASSQGWMRRMCEVCQNSRAADCGRD